MSKKSCYVCTGEWSHRMLRVESKAFDSLNPGRNPSSNQPLNSQQRNYLYAHFFDQNGKLVKLCPNHCASYASIGERTVSNLKLNFVNQSPGQLFTLDQPPPQKLKKVAAYKTPPSAVASLINWCVRNSSFVPNSVNIRRFNAPFVSMKKAFRAFVAENPEHKMCWGTFRVLRSRHCPSIKVFYIF